MRVSSTNAPKAFAFLIGISCTIITAVTALSTKQSTTRLLPLQNRQHALLQVEKDYIEKYPSNAFVIGSDESGMGSIAGPIVCASISIKQSIFDGISSKSTESSRAYCPVAIVKDAKLLTKQERNDIYTHIINNPQTYAYSITVRSASEINDIVMNTDTSSATDSGSRLNKLWQDAMCESICKVQNDLLHHIDARDTEKGSSRKVVVHLTNIVDGHRSIPKSRLLNWYNNEKDFRNTFDLSISSRPWKKGDEYVYSVALASVLARVVYDHIMQEVLHKQEPQYNWNINRGYPTLDHIQAIHSHGPSQLHHRLYTKPLQGRNMSKLLSNSVSDRQSDSTTDRRTMLASALSLFTIAANTSAGGTQVASATYIDKKRGGVSFPEVGEIEQAIPTEWDGMSPFSSKDFARLDSSSDALFYDTPRFVEHVDEGAVNRMTNYITDNVLRQTSKSSDSNYGNDKAILDLCASWTSHIDAKILDRIKLMRIAGLGMNEQELKANKQLTEYTVRDLNENAKLPYEDNSFDCVLCQLSIDYLTSPLEVCAEIARVLKENGQVYIFFSNRLFLSKAVAIWTGADDIDHAYTVGAYLHYGGKLVDINAQDLSLRQGRDQRVVGDPLYVVSATKK